MEIKIQGNDFQIHKILFAGLQRVEICGNPRDSSHIEEKCGIYKYTKPVHL